MEKWSPKASLNLWGIQSKILGSFVWAHTVLGLLVIKRYWKKTAKWSPSIFFKNDIPFSFGSSREKVLEEPLDLRERDKEESEGGRQPHSVRQRAGSSWKEYLGLRKHDTWCWYVRVSCYHALMQLLSINPLPLGKSPCTVDIAMGHSSVLFCFFI